VVCIEYSSWQETSGTDETNTVYDSNSSSDYEIDSTSDISFFLDFLLGDHYTFPNIECDVSLVNSKIDVLLKETYKEVSYDKRKVILEWV